MKDYLTCGLCGVNISWEHLEINFAAMKEFHDKQCGQPRPMTINYAELPTPQLKCGVNGCNCKRENK